eukprot:m.54664 g.54664  ORF g.54664 m.54664 type:complete len:54 (+) comp11438_c0_seq1:1670-1831(+)
MHNSCLSHGIGMQVLQDTTDRFVANVAQGYFRSSWQARQIGRVNYFLEHYLAK